MIPLPLPRLLTRGVRIRPWLDRWCVIVNGKRYVGHDGEGLTAEEARLLVEWLELEGQAMAASQN